jgi:hypothetical protein
MVSAVGALSSFVIVPVPSESMILERPPTGFDSATVRV